MFKIDMKKFDNAMGIKGFNPIDLAKASEVSPATITKTLQTNTIYSYKVLGKIAKALNITPSELVLERSVQRRPRKNKKRPPQI